MIPAISTIIPFCLRDKHLVQDAINSIVKQTTPSWICVVGDFVDWKTIENLAWNYNKNPNVLFFRTRKLSGPYCIANSIVKHHLPDGTKYLAIQDADDISYPRRLDTQILQMMMNKTRHCSSPMKHVALEGYTGLRHLKEPTLLCGQKAKNVPLGRFINGTRTIEISLFEELNGFPPIFCSGDICFDNTIQFLKIPTTVTKQVLGERRLHPNSLTNHPDSSRASQIREVCMQFLYKCLDAIRTNPTTETAKEYGGLDEAEELDQLC